MLLNADISYKPGTIFVDITTGRSLIFISTSLQHPMWYLLSSIENYVVVLPKSQLAFQLQTEGARATLSVYLAARRRKEMIDGQIWQRFN